MREPVGRICGQGQDPQEQKKRYSRGLFAYVLTHGEKYVEVRKVFYFLRFIFICVMRNPCYIVSCQRHGASDGGTFLLITYTCLLSLWGSRQPILRERSEEVMFIWHIEIGYISGLGRMTAKNLGARMQIAHGFVVSITVQKENSSKSMLRIHFWNACGCVYATLWRVVYSL